MMWSVLNFFAIIVTALASPDPEVFMPESYQTVFTIKGTGMDGRFTADFDVTCFDLFYKCLCDSCRERCTATCREDGSVFETTGDVGASLPDVTISCEAFEFEDTTIVCVKERFSGVGNEECRPQSIQNKTLCSTVLLEWGGNQQVEAKSVSKNIIVSPGLHCDGKCQYISSTNSISPPLTPQTTRAPTPTTKPPPPLPPTTTRRDA